MPNRTVRAFSGAQWRAIPSLFAFFFMFAPTHAAPRIYRDHVDPHWYAGHTRFWYRNDSAGGETEFICVDPEHGERRPAFDPNRVAIELTKLMGSQVGPNHLPIDALDFDADPGAILLIRRGKSWRLDPKTYEIKPIDAVAAAGTYLPAEKEPRPSKDSTDETTITFDNQTHDPVEVYWIEASGRRTHYNTIKPGAQLSQPTFVGHVWLITDAKEKVLAAFEAAAEPATAIIDGKPPADRSPTTRPAPSDRSGALDRRIANLRHGKLHRMGSGIYLSEIRICSSSRQTAASLN